MKREVNLTICFLLLILISLDLVVAELPLDNPENCFKENIIIRGDANGNGIIDLSDPILILNYL